MFNLKVLNVSVFIYSSQLAGMSKFAFAVEKVNKLQNISDVFRCFYYLNKVVCTGGPGSAQLCWSWLR